MPSIELITVAGVDAVAHWKQLREQYDSTGKYPVLLGSRRDYDAWCKRRVDSSSNAEILAEARTVAFPDWFLERRNAELDPSPADRDMWPSEPPEPIDIAAHLEPESGLPRAEALVGLVPCASPPELFGQLPWGGWSDCPWPAEHAAVMRYWLDKYGAEVVSITQDTIECHVARPPRDRDAAIRLAKEQMAYCESITEGGTLCAATIAAGLLTSHTWYFWWSEKEPA